MITNKQRACKLFEFLNEICLHLVSQKLVSQNNDIRWCMRTWYTAICNSLLWIWISFESDFSEKNDILHSFRSSIYGQRTLKVIFFIFLASGLSLSVYLQATMLPMTTVRPDLATMLLTENCASLKSVCFSSQY